MWTRPRCGVRPSRACKHTHYDTQQSTVKTEQDTTWDIVVTGAAPRRQSQQTSDKMRPRTPPKRRRLVMAFLSIRRIRDQCRAIYLRTDIYLYSQPPPIAHPQPEHGRKVWEWDWSICSDVCNSDHSDRLKSVIRHDFEEGLPCHDRAGAAFDARYTVGGSVGLMSDDDESVHETLARPKKSFTGAHINRIVKHFWEDCLLQAKIGQIFATARRPGIRVLQVRCCRKSHSRRVNCWLWTLG